MVIEEKIFDKCYQLNPLYILRNDVSRVVLAIKSNKDFASAFNPSLTTFIHPVFAVALSFFKGDKTFRENVQEVAAYFGICYDEALAIVGKFVDNKNVVGVEYDNAFFYFPRHILIEADDHSPLRTYTPGDFEIGVAVDVDTKRLNIPLEISLLVNNRCVTDCVYCYADKRKIYDCTIPFSRLQEIIAEARSIGVASFDVQGGELFLYPRWDALLETLFTAGYRVYLSTKVPITVAMIRRLVELGVTEIQFSLDSIYSEDLQKNLCVGPGYQAQILRSVKLADEAGLQIKINAVMTNLIYDPERIGEFIDYFKTFKNVRIVQLIVPARSAYKSEEMFSAYRLRESQILTIKRLVEEKKESCPFLLLFDCPAKDDSSLLSFDEKKEKFCRRSRCTGNQSCMTILPDGDVTICEETYFNPHLKLGNILHHSILEVWNSEKAKELFFISRSRFPKESPCSRCAEFEECRYDLGVCWSDVTAAYGEDKWFYPVPDCPYAPIPENRISVW